MAALTAITRFPGKLCFPQCASSARRVPPNGHRISTCRAAPTSADGSRAARTLARRDLLLLGSLATGVALSSPDKAMAFTSDGVSFTNPKAGATVSSPFTVQMQVSGLELRPASEGLQPGSGHHHLIVDGPPPAEGVAVPFDTTHFHYGKAQTEASLVLPPGKHTLTLQFADATHVSYGPKFSKTITVTVAP
eukprot:CAMPEP_0177752858 /NCGR_PEP_ID=MMETSP0491_2-20121128/1141_1 /TAXON_ID=63592 /ORGANISM="Tetraselmis chuii, Strain PLY429" /LENGTH=191 /DNA_ID=CAMNT_0019268085 /DNA_START=85 /DNA_END=660 /DNA_ORIENTATION=+